MNRLERIFEEIECPACGSHGHLYAYRETSGEQQRVLYHLSTSRTQTIKNPPQEWQLGCFACKMRQIQPANLNPDDWAYFKKHALK